MLLVVVNNSKKKEDGEFKERVLEKMKAQVRKKILGQKDGSRLNPVASHSCTKSNSIQQIQNQTV